MVQEPRQQASPLGERLPRAYSHRDCELRPPFRRSFEAGFQHVEADVYCLAGRLLVAHDLTQLRPRNTLHALYLAPLRALAERNAGKVFADGGPLWLYVDMKTSAQAGFGALLRLLARHEDLVASAPPGTPDPRPLRVVLSGNRPDPSQVAAMAERPVTLDGRIPDLGVFTDASVMPIISDDWRKVFAWRGRGPMPPAEAARLAAMVETAHAAGQMLRFWGTPDAPGAERERVWTQLFEAGVDLLNTDDIAGLRAFIRKQ